MKTNIKVNFPSEYFKVIKPAHHFNITFPLFF